MILWFHSSLRRQVLGVLLLSLFCVAFDYFLSPTPPVRLKLPLLIQGLIAGAEISGFTFLLHFLVSLAQKGYLPRLEVIQLRFFPKDPFHFLGSLILVCLAEEIFFRGYVFNFFLAMGLFPALGLHACILCPAFYLGRKDLLWLLIRIIQASFLAFAFAQSKSLSVCVSASLILVLFERFFLFPALKWARSLLKIEKRHVLRQSV